MKITHYKESETSDYTLFESLSKNAYWVKVTVTD